MTFSTSVAAKRIAQILTISLLLIASTVLLPWPGRVKAQNRVEPDLTVHEWGTFTSIAGNDGNAVEWAPLTGAWPSATPVKGQATNQSPLTDSDLPSFVEHLGVFAFKSGLRGTVRMETPVLYFYSPRELTVSVDVRFAKGLITEWYPHASYVSSVDGYNSASLKKAADGSISWNSVHLEPGRAMADFPREEAEHHYYAARQTSSVPVRVNASGGEQQEKFLFYRGVSAGSVPISAKLAPDGKVLVKNLSRQEIPSVILFERRGSKLGYRVSSSIQDQIALDPPELTANIADLYRDLEEILIARGLYRDEAHAMLQTWRDFWFEEGSRLFYIVPSGYVDNILPLNINPAPETTVRVFVGRMEVVTPATQQAVETALASRDNVTLNKYARFLEPIMRILEERNPAKAKQLTDLFYGPCACEENKPCDESNQVSSKQ